jgi:transcriptional regulator with XRE-family HTH domain
MRGRTARAAVSHPLLGRPSACYAHHVNTEEGSRKALGEFIRTQRRLANMSLRQLANLAKVSNPYLSQVERGIYKPSAEVLKGIADALHISAEALFVKIGLIDESPGDAAERPDVEEAIRLDPALSAEQKEALIRVYRSFLSQA